MLSRRFFLKVLMGSIVLAGCGGGRPVFNEQVKKNTNIVAVTDTSNWIVDENGTRLNLFDYDFVDGLTNYVRWADLEIYPGVYNWKGLDRLLSEAAQAGKKLSYNILGGNHAPEWVYAERMIPSQYCTCCIEGTKKRTYLPWIESPEGRILNLSLLEIWENTIDNFSMYIRDHPFRDSISYLAITGGPTSNGLEIMWGNEYNSNELGWGSREEELFIEFWKKLVDIFLEKFSDIPLGLAFTDNFPSRTYSCAVERNIDISTEILDYAINAAVKQNALVIPMGLWFGNISPNLLATHSLVKLLMSYSSFAVQGHINSTDEVSMMNMLQVATDIGSHWIELWHNDITKNEYQSIFLSSAQKNTLTIQE